MSPLFAYAADESISSDNSAKIIFFIGLLPILNIKSEQNYISVLHNILLTLTAHKSLFLCRRH